MIGVLQLAGSRPYLRCRGSPPAPPSPPPVPIDVAIPAVLSGCLHCVLFVAGGSTCRGVAAAAFPPRLHSAGIAEPPLLLADQVPSAISLVCSVPLQRMPGPLRPPVPVPHLAWEWYPDPEERFGYPLEAARGKHLSQRS